MVRLHKDKTEEVCRILSQAMQNDPLSAFWFPDKTRRVQDLIDMFLPEVKYCFHHGIVYATSERMEGITLWLTVKSIPRTLGMLINNGALSLLFKFPFRTIRSMNAYEKFAAKIHRNIAPLPHWYLHNIAVQRDFRGKGFAGKLIKPILLQLNKEEISCYLETQNPVNVHIYEHYGFRVMDVSEIPGTKGIKNWAMLKVPDISGRKT